MKGAILITRCSLFHIEACSIRVCSCVCVCVCVCVHLCSAYGCAGVCMYVYVYGCAGVCMNKYVLVCEFKFQKL